jgi:hypothetical protein
LLHRAQLEQLEWMETAAHALLAKQHRAIGIPLDEECGDCQNRQCGNQQQECQNNIQTALHHEPPRQKDLRALSRIRQQKR